MLAQHVNLARDNIILIGMPGSGKSTVGVVLAKVLNYAFIDVDLVIQQHTDMILHELIDAYGPEGFIEIEGNVLSNINVEHAVISTGGSAVYSERAMEQLSKSGTVVYLQIDLDELEERLPNFSERGVVMRHSSSISLGALFEERAALYEKFADVKIDVSGQSITDIVKNICCALKV